MIRIRTETLDKGSVSHTLDEWNGMWEGQDEFSVWLYGHKLSKEQIAFAEVTKRLLRWARTKRDGKEDALIAVVAIRYREAGPHGLCEERVHDVLHDRGCSLKLECDSNSIIPIASTARFRLPDSCFERLSDAQLNNAESWPCATAQGAAHRIAVVKVGDCQSVVVDLEGYCRDTATASRAVNTSLSHFERLVAVLAHRRRLKSKISYFSSTLTKLSQFLLTRSGVNQFVLCIDSADKPSTASTLRFGSRALGFSLNSSAAALEMNAAADNSISDDDDLLWWRAVAIQRWWKRLVARRDVVSEEQKHRHQLMLYEQSEFDALQRKFVLLPRTPAPPSVPSEKRRRRVSTTSANQSTCTEPLARQDQSVGVNAACWPRRSVGVMAQRGVTCSAEEVQRIRTERDSLRTEVKELRDLLRLNDTTAQWQYMVQKNEAQRNRIAELESKLM